MWVGCLIRLVFIAYLFIKADKTDDWQFHLHQFHMHHCHLHYLISVMSHEEDFQSTYWGQNHCSLDAQLVDGNELVCHVTWPKNGSTQTLYDNPLPTAEQQFLVSVIFDDVKGSVKSHDDEQDKRAHGIWRLHDNNRHPFQQDIHVLSRRILIINMSLCHLNETSQPNNFQLIGEKENPFAHEEVDVCTIGYLFLLLQCSDIGHIQVRSYDTYILLLLLYFFLNQRPQVLITMLEFDGSIVDMKASAM